MNDMQEALVRTVLHRVILGQIVQVAGLHAGEIIYQPANVSRPGGRVARQRARSLAGRMCMVEESAMMEVCVKAGLQACFELRDHAADQSRADCVALTRSSSYSSSN